MSTPTEKQLRASFSSIKGKFTTIENGLASQGTTKLNEARYENIKKCSEGYWGQIDSLVDQIFAFCADQAAETALTAEHAALYQRYNDICERLTELKPTSAPVTTKAKVKLPDLKPPTFDGDIVNWTSFYDLFKAAVHNNDSIEPAQKLQYLMDSLKGESGNVIKHLNICDAHYDEAWKLLNETYNRHGEIIDAHLLRFINQPVMKEESSKNLRKIVDTSRECIQALKVLKMKTDDWDAIIILIIREKLDPETKRQWFLTLTPSSLPTQKDLFEFLDKRARSIQDAPLKSKPTSSQTSSQSHSQPKSSTQPPKKETKSLHVHSEAKCRVCNDPVHPVYNCPKFQRLSPQGRVNEVKTKGLCFNCLAPGHISSSCPSGSSCKKCSRRHHTMVHLESPQQQKETSEEPAVTNAHVAHCPTRPTFSQVLLPTAVVNLWDNLGRPQPVRALLDTGSESSFISEECVRSLNLTTKPTNVVVKGLSATSVTCVKKKVHLILSSRVYDFKTALEALIVEKVTGNLPSTNCKKEDFGYLSHLPLADPEFYDSKPIDLLLGADIFYQLNRPTECVKGPAGFPAATDSMLGWIVAGKYSSSKVTSVTSLHVNCELDTMVQRFWELERLPEEKIFSLEEKAAERHFVSTVRRLEDGRYVVRLPMKENFPDLGDSRSMALKRWFQMEKKMTKDPTLRKMYVEFMREYAQQGHMKKVPSHQLKTDKPVYYIPHHAVLKECSTITKLRVVFDASAKSSTGTSLNENMMVGGKTQDDLIAHIIRFRIWLYVMKTDGRQMYRQFLVDSEDWDLQRVFWRESPDLPLDEWYLVCVTQGEAASAYLATRCLKKLAEDGKTLFPIASSVVLKNVYMDDVITGAFTIASALELQREMIELFQSGHIELRKWSANHPELLSNIPLDHREMKNDFEFQADTHVKALGISWNPSVDEFSFSNVRLSSQGKLTKRTILAEVAKIFDPLGWLAPVVIKMKILLQGLWQEKLGWDDTVPAYIVEEWSLLQEQFEQLQPIRIPRLAVLAEFDAVEIVGFSDASEKAYAAVIFLRSRKGEKTEVHLFVSKTRVAPLKQETLPRLELCGAVLLTELVNTCLKYLQIPISGVYLFTDSTIVLAWLDSSPSSLKTFVANRVSQIQQSFPRKHWYHVKGVENPADCISRGIYPNELPHHKLWWTGPEWLVTDLPQVQEPQELAYPLASLPEVKRSKTENHLHLVLDNSILERYSSLQKMQRITALCFRFYYRLHEKKSKIRPRRPPISEPISLSELDFALMRCIALCQRIHFAKELTDCENCVPISKKSKIITLSPFLDANGLIRVGGRLRHSELSYEQKHPILLPRHSQLVINILRNEHLRGLHAGPQLLLSMVRQRYWIIRGRDAIRHFVAKCLICYRSRAKTLTQLMGDLPKARVNFTIPFVKTGLDFAGPIICKSSFTPRSPQKFKAYVCVFVCMVTHAIHLELVSNLSSNAFIAALKRFVSRRGLCSDLYSDNGTNFVGAEKEVCGLIENIEKSSSSGELRFDNQLMSISWHFNPPSAPHFGGIWEAAVKLMKTHLKKVVGDALLNYEELLTVLTQIEACVNSRPLTPMSNSPDEFEALTPGHFLIHSALNAIPEADLTEAKLLPRERWLHCQKILQHFWSRWQKEYLASLQQRNKWKSAENDIRVGELVILKDDRYPPLQWKLARVTELFPGTDGHVRVVSVKTSDGEYKRPIAKICPFPKESTAEGKSEEAGE